MVVTGHSQGGATAMVASILLESLNPTVITFGQPIAADPGCPYIPSERYFRFVNFVVDTFDNAPSNTIADVVVVAPAAWSGSAHYGHMIALGPDVSAVQYYGIDGEADANFFGGVFDSGLAPHDISEFEYGYLGRITALATNPDQVYPIRANGFLPGTPCGLGDLSDLCEYRCDRESFECTETLEQALCVPGSCDFDFECESGYCSGGACAVGLPEDGVVTDGCPCDIDEECASGICKFSDSLFKCEAGSRGGLDTSFAPRGVQRAFSLTAGLIIAGLAWLF